MEDPDLTYEHSSANTETKAEYTVRSQTGSLLKAIEFHDRITGI